MYRQEGTKMTRPQSVAGLLESFRAASTTPKLIWYGEANERVELSGRVLDNWVAKTSNLLVEELDAADGTVVAMDLPPHWRTLVWALASWQVGAVTLLGEGPGQRTTSPDLRLSMDQDRTVSAHTGSELLVLIARGALDMRWPGELPPGAVDYAATVRSFGDVYLEEPANRQGTLAVETTTVLTFKDLAESPLTVADGKPDEKPAADGGVWLIPASLPLRSVLGAALRVWSADGTVVLVHASVEGIERLAEGERVTARLAA